MPDGTTIVPDGQPFLLSELEEGARHMVVVPRHFGVCWVTAYSTRCEKELKQIASPGGFCRVPTIQSKIPGSFLTLSVPAFKLSRGYEQYRSLRRAMLETYAFSFLRKNPKLKQVVGIATEPPMRDQGSSEDMIVVLHPGRMDPDFLMKLEEQRKICNIAQARELHRICDPRERVSGNSEANS